MQGKCHEWHVHTHQLDGALLAYVMIIGVAYTHATRICVVCVHNIEVHTLVHHIAKHPQQAIPHNWWCIVSTQFSTYLANFQYVTKFDLVKI